MSAIWGIFRFDGGPVTKRDLDAMGSVLAHRSPDGRRSVVLGEIGLGHGALHVTREDRRDTQPLNEADGLLTIVADVRLDNRAELALVLGISAEALGAMPDSALVLHAYRKWGEACAAHLLGDFAFAIWDGAARKLVLGRDHMGQRYVHYHEGRGFLAFATEAKALHALPEVPRTLNDAVLMRSLMADFHTHDSSTHFEGIVGLPGGTMLIVEANGTTRPQRYWTPQAAPEHISRDEAYYVATYRRVLEEAVACRLSRLDAPPGLLLSGGMDSGAIAGLAAAALPAGLKLVTATSVLPEGANHPNDARSGAEWCRRHMPHLDHRWFVRGSASGLDDLDRANHVRDGVPTGLDYVFAGLHRLLRERGVRLVMDGIGGDATLNPRGLRLLPNLLRAGRFRAFIAALEGERRALGMSTWQILRQKVLPFTPLGHRVRAWRASQRGGDRWPHPYANRALRDRLAAAGQIAQPALIPDRDRTADVETRLWILDLCQNRAQPQGANEAAALGLELTRPMFDKRVVEFGLAIPEALQIVKGRNRYIGLRALADIVPPEFRTRRRGQEFLDPASRQVTEAAMPEIRARLTRMEGRESLKAYLDLDRLMADAEQPARLDDAQMMRFRRAFAVANYVAWFRRENL